jgi:hypothetical protein
MPYCHLVIAGACHLTKSAAPLLSRRLPSLFPSMLVPAWTESYALPYG